MAALTPVSLGRSIELVDFVDVTYPRVEQLLRDRWADLLGASHPDRTGAARTTFGVQLRHLRLQAEVGIRVADFRATRLPVRSCMATIECTPLQLLGSITSLRSDVTAYPVTRSITVIWLEVSYKASGHRPGRLLVDRVIRACVEDKFDRLVQAIRPIAAAGVLDTGLRDPSRHSVAGARRPG